MSKITVNILNFHSIINSHIEIVLENQSPKGTYYYRISSTATPKSRAVIDDEECLKAIDQASEKQVLEIDANLSDLISAWRNKYHAEYFTCCYNNCADVSAWFLETYADIPNPGNCASPVTINYLFCGFFAPSFLQCCTLPGRVMDYVEDSQEGKFLLS